jgi:serine/threonine protein kinase/DNA polymerase III delta prime subunit
MLLKLSALALQPLVGIVCKSVGIEAGEVAGEKVSEFLRERFTNHSAKLIGALGRANERAWDALEFALAGDSWLDIGARADKRAYRDQVRAFLAAIAKGYPPAGSEEFRRQCLKELRAARHAGLLSSEAPDLQALAGDAGRFAGFANPTALHDAEFKALADIAEHFPSNQYPNLRRLLAIRPPNGPSILVAAASYFFRREIVGDEGLCREGMFAELTKVREKQDEGFGILREALEVHGTEMKDALGSLQEKVDAIGDQVARLLEKVNTALETRNLSSRPLSSGDSLSIRNDEERLFIRDMVRVFRSLTTDQRRQCPELINGIAKLEVVAGTFGEAEQDFRELATVVADPALQAEAHYNAYLAALEKRDWTAALKHLQDATQIDAGRFAPFPLDKYWPERILGAGGFGVAFLCQDQDLRKPVVIKTLAVDNLARDGDSVLGEARILSQIDHPAVVKLINCDYADRASRSRPFLVMEYFESTNLAEHIRSHGQLAHDDLRLIMKPIVEALHTAHEKDILHRDIKPANILIRREASEWQVRLIDFGLALKHDIAQAGGQHKGENSLAGAAVAGTLEYAPPEQLGRLPGFPVSRQSDIYSFAKTCCYALFGTTQPLRKHWAELPAPLAELLENCLEENPQDRPNDFQEILHILAGPSDGASDDRGRARILEHYQNRLSASISRSPLLKIAITKTGRLLDMSRLANLGPDLPNRTLSAIIAGGQGVKLDLRTRPSSYGFSATTPEDTDERARLFDLLDRKVRRFADIAKRETGVHALWLGYPLLYATAGEGEADRWVLAPVFLWPAVIELDSGGEKQLRLGRASQPEGARFNQALAIWIKRELRFALNAPDEDEMDALDGETLHMCLQRIATQFPAVELPDRRSSLGPVPDRKELSSKPGSRLVHAAVLGYFRWQNESVLEDLDKIREMNDVRGIVKAFISTVSPPQPRDVPAPPDADRFLVSDSDFSQERVVWQARQGPGLVFHGPPGTGKSQTIVNIIADTLAHERTVLMVCQKQAATRVVMERLRAVGLADLCLEVHDAELDRKEIFSQIRNQVENLRVPDAGSIQLEREHIARQIGELEAELDRHAQAFHRRHPRLGLSYRDMKDREQRTYLEWPAARPLLELQKLLADASQDSVEEIMRRARDVGRWFAEGDALNNPWRFARFDRLPAVSLVRKDVGDILAQLQVLDTNYLENIRKHGPAMPLPANLQGFQKVGCEVLNRLQVLGRTPGCLARRWLPILRRAGEQQRQQYLAHCQQAMTLAAQIQRTPLDPQWVHLANETPEFSRKAEDLLRQLETLQAAHSTPDAALALHWLRTLQAENGTGIERHRNRCREAQILAQQVKAIPKNLHWQEVAQCVPTFPEIAAFAHERLKALGEETNRTTRLITQAWMKALRRSNDVQIAQARKQCGEAMDLARRVEAIPQDPRWAQVPADCGGSGETMAPLAKILERFAEMREPEVAPFAQLVRNWVRTLRRAGEPEIEKRFAECRGMVGLAQQVMSLKADRSWEPICSGRTSLEQELLRTHAEEFLRHSNGWFSFLRGPFRRSRRALLRLRTDATDETLPILARSLIQYLEACQTFEQLRDLNHRLAPEGTAMDGMPAAEFPSFALDALEMAAWLIRMERQQTWFAPLLEEFLRQMTGPGPMEESLRTHIQTLSVRKQLEQVTQTLVPDLHPRLDLRGQLKFPTAARKALDEAVWLIQQERRHAWLSPLFDEFLQGKGASPPLLAELRDYLRRTSLHTRLVQANQSIAPGSPSKTVEQTAYPDLAAQGLHQAEELWEKIAAYKWAGPLLNEVLGQSNHGTVSLHGLKTYLQACRCRQQLAHLNQTLLPDLQPAPDEASQVRFPRDVYQGFEEAEHLCQLAAAHPWINGFLDVLQPSHARSAPPRAS